MFGWALVVLTGESRDNADAGFANVSATRRQWPASEGGPLQGERDGASGEGTADWLGRAEIR